MPGFFSPVFFLKNHPLLWVPLPLLAMRKALFHAVKQELSVFLQRA